MGDNDGAAFGLLRHFCSVIYGSADTRGAAPHPGQGLSPWQPVYKGQGT